MPVILMFFGIVIRMYHKEHEPAQFHAEYQNQQGKFDLTGHLTVGNIRSRIALRLIKEWAEMHGRELQANWEHMRAGRPLERIPPLEWGSTMTFLPFIIDAEYRGGYRIHVRFSDNLEKTIDFQQWLDGPVFEPLKDPEYFKRFFVEGGTVTWPNGADIAPETLYESAKSGEAA